MGEAMQTLTESLRSVSLKYHAIVTNEQFDSRPWRANAHLLSPIVLELMQQAEIQICLCETEIAANNDKQVKTFDRRANLYSEWETGKSQQSELDVAIVGVTKEISCLSDEISAGERKIEALHEKIVQSKKDRDYWDTVFKATCWIPFANIGTGIKKSYEDGQFYIAVNVHIAEIEENQRRISVLNQNKQHLTQKKTAGNEASGELSNQITKIEGEIALTTTLLNTLRSEMRLWEAVLVACSEIKIQLIYANEKKSVVMECFERLFKVQDWLFRQQMTDQYIRNCLCKGNMLMLGEVLKQNEYLLSQNKRFIALMQTDNNFVVYNSQGPMWASNTYDAQGVGFVELDKNGLTSLQGTNRAWNAKRSGAANLMMQDDGNLVTYNKDHQPLWATDTYTYANIPGICFSNNETT